MKFYICKHCGNIIAYVHASGAPVVCCGEEMRELIPNTVDAASEKHIPVIEKEAGRAVVRVGSAEHPMSEAHSIQWVALQTREGNQRKLLSPGAKPQVCFALCPGDEIIAAYAYCNLHGLWKA